MRKFLNRWTILPTALLGLSLAAPRPASAQAIATAGRNAEIAPFFTTSIVSPDWGSSRNFGYTAGLDYTRLSHGVGQPALEFRVMSANGLRVDEFSYGGGLKLQSNPIGIMRPYATMLVGMGTINIHPDGKTLAKNTDFMYALGGGLDFMFRSNFKAKADFLQETWSFAPNHLTPIAISFGLSYTLPFGQGGMVQ